jgi:xylulose-5-phosphate/fructose-6-phosphate phosphoketolase
MPGQAIDKPDPQPAASHLPSSVDELLVAVKKSNLSDDDRRALDKFRRTANYIAAGELVVYIYGSRTRSNMR